MLRVRVSCASWILWVFTALTAITYSVIALVTFSNLATWVDHTKFSSGGNIDPGNINSGMMASCFLGFASVATFAVVSGIILLSNLFGHSLIGGGGVVIGTLMTLHQLIILGKSDSAFTIRYGFLIGCSFNTGFVVLLAGIVLNTFSGYMSSNTGGKWWTDTDQGVYVTTWVFSYILTGIFFIMFIGLIFARGFFVGGTEAPSTAFNGDVHTTPAKGDTGDVEMPVYQQSAPQPTYDGPTAAAPPPAWGGSGGGGGAAGSSAAPPGAWGGGGGGFGGGWGSSNHF